jgi:MFS transporter, DHA1 family, multidrug resistance protein
VALAHAFLALSLSSLTRTLIPLPPTHPEVPEHRLEIGFLTSFSIPLVTLLYGWTARESVHWIVPVIAGALYLPGVFLTFQSVL